MLARLILCVKMTLAAPKVFGRYVGVIYRLSSSSLLVFRDAATKYIIRHRKIGAGAKLAG